MNTSESPSAACPICSALIPKIALAPPPSLRERMSTIPAAVEKAVFKALAKDPKDRFRSVREFAFALEQGR